MSAELILKDSKKSTLARARENVAVIRTAKDFIVAVTGSDSYSPNVFVRLPSGRKYKFKDVRDKKSNKLIARKTIVEFSGFESLADVTLDFFGDVLPFDSADELADEFYEFIGENAIYESEKLKATFTFVVDAKGVPLYMSDFECSGAGTEFECSYINLLEAFREEQVAEYFDSIDTECEDEDEESDESSEQDDGETAQTE